MNVIQVKPDIKEVTKPKYKVKKRSKVQEHFRSIFIWHAIFGYNFIKRTGWEGILINLYCFSVMFCCLGYSTYDFCTSGYTYTWMSFFMAIEYSITVLYNSYIFNIKNESDDSFDNIDVHIGFGTKEFNNIKYWHNFIIISVFIKRILSTICAIMVFKIELTFRNLMSDFVRIFFMLGVDLSQMPRLLFFGSLYYKMKLLRMRIEAECRPGKHGRPTETYRVVYKEIIDALDSSPTSKNLKPMLFLNLVCSVPKIMFHIHQILWCIKDFAIPIWFLIFVAIEIIQMGMLPCLPGVITEMIANEIDKMKISLTNYLYDDNKGFNDRGSAEGFLRYLQLRPLRCSVWRMLPVDLTLPVSLLSLCTTYLIVLIQFSDLY